MKLARINNNVKYNNALLANRIGKLSDISGVHECIYINMNAIIIIKHKPNYWSLLSFYGSLTSICERKSRANAYLLSSSHEGTSREFGFCIAEVRVAARRIPLSELFIIPLSDVPTSSHPLAIPALYVHPPQSSSAAILRLCLLNFIYSNPARLLKVTSAKRKRNRMDFLAAQKLNS